MAKNTSANSNEAVAITAKKPHSLKSLVVPAVCSVVFLLIGILITLRIVKGTGVLASPLNKNVIISEQNATIAIAKKVGPSVVSIGSTTTSRSAYGLRQGEGAGTGIVLSSDGMILTNKHVVEGASALVVTTSEGKEYSAKILALDPVNDVAFLKVEASGLVPAELGDSSKIEIGQFVVAIGNALGQFQNTVTTGVISGKSRPITAGDGQGASERLTNLFQTDAAINPGNSGGPLVNVEGQVIGMNTAVAGEGSQNIGFAIPVDDIKADIEQLRQKGKLTRIYLGVRFVPVSKSFARANGLRVDYGAYVYGRGSALGVVAGSPAAKAGIREGDIILKINGTKIDESNSLVSVINKLKVGEGVDVVVLRGEKEETLRVTLAEAPENL